MKKVILASSSAMRAKLLRKAGLNFTVMKSGYRERLQARKDPRKLVEFLALQKARTVAKKFPKDIVIGADSVMVLDGKVFGKPKGAREHSAMLKKMSGRSHVMLTGVAIVSAHPRSEKTFSHMARVTFKRLSDNEITSYVRAKEGSLAAGGYRIQKQAKQFVKNIRGNIDTVIGLPVKETIQRIAAMQREV